MPADEKDSAATNRLLDLLRSQQTGKSTTEGNASGTLDANPPVEKETPAATDEPNSKVADKKPKAPKSEKSTPKKGKPSKVSTSIVPETIVDEPLPKTVESAPVSSDEIRAKLGNLASKTLGNTAEEAPVEPSPPVADPESETLAPKPEEAVEEQADSVAQGIAADLMDTSDDEPVADQTPSESVDPGDETDSEEKDDESTFLVDPSHFQLHKDVAPPSKLRDLPYEFSNWALGIRRKITFQITPEGIKVLKTISAGPRNVLAGMEDYPLPYITEDLKITHRDDLLSHILDNLDVKLWKKGTMFRLASSFIETHTKIFKAPPVKGKEIQDLITWTAKKNLPFSSENVNIDHLMLGSEKGELKRNIIIGVGSNETITFMSDVFKKRKFDLQNVTTVPFLDWETFKHCYPDRLRGCIAIVHLSQNETTITMVKSGKMEFTREMAVGVKDYQKALIQRVIVGDDAVNITEEMAKEYLMAYGIPKDTEAEIPGTGISLYKISIFLRPILERMTNELNRSLDYFRKEVADVECQEVYMTGPGAAIPNLVESFASQLDRPTEHLNPLRQGDFEFTDTCKLDPQQIPIFASNFSLALKSSSGINLMPIARKQHFQYKVFNKLAIVLATILLPVYFLVGYFSYMEQESLEANVTNMNSQWQKLSEQSQEYFTMLDDLEYLGTYWGFLENDRINSHNQLILLKLISSEIPDNIRVTSLIFRPASSQDGGSAIKQAAHVDRIALSGFVNAHAGIADIQLTNFIMRLEGLNMFSSIERDVQGSSNTDDTRLFFTLKMGVAIK